LDQQSLPPERRELSPQQKKLLRRFAQGKTDEKIAEEFGCRAHLVAAQRQTIMEKLEIRSQAQLAAAARQFASWPRPRAGGGS
jgi:DNA-binding CsgD family transcriptional regulator